MLDTHCRLIDMITRSFLHKLLLVIRFVNMFRNSGLRRNPTEEVVAAVCVHLRFRNSSMRADWAGGHGLLFHAARATHNLPSQMQSLPTVCEGANGSFC
jgi:hypothetical protein